MDEKRTNEIEKIITTLRYYSKAFKEWDYEKLIKAFHPETTISYVENDKLVITKPYPIWKDVFERNRKKDPGIKYDVTLEHIDQSSTVAFARMKWLIDSPKEIEDTVDYLILMKFDTKWLIVNKMPHTIATQKEVA